MCGSVHGVRSGQRKKSHRRLVAWIATTAATAVGSGDWLGSVFMDKPALRHANSRIVMTIISGIESNLSRGVLAGGNKYEKTGTRIRLV